MSSPWSGVGRDFLSRGTWAIGQGPGAPDRRLFRAVLRSAIDEYGPQSLLEIGPGSGIDVAALEEEGLLLRLTDYRGVDLTEEFVAGLRDAFPGLSFEVGDVLELDPALAADVVYARHVLEHVPDGLRGLEKLIRAMRGLLVVSWFIRPTWDERAVGCVEADGFLHQTYSARRLVELAGDLGTFPVRFDFDHHSTAASVWVFGAPRDVLNRATSFASSPAFLRSLISPPEVVRERERDLVDVVAGAAAQRDRVAGLLRSLIETRALMETEDEIAEDPTIRALDRAASAAYSSEPLRRYRRLVLWGFTESLDSMRHIFRHFARAGEALGIEVVRLPDHPDSVGELRTSDLVLAVDVEGHHLRYVDDADYVLHNFAGSHPVFARLPPTSLLRLQTYTVDAEEYGVAWDPVRRYDREARTLFQPWGTDLLAGEFLEPAFEEAARSAYFVGAVWDANSEAIDDLDRLLAERGIELVRATHVSDEENIALVRESRVAPAFAGPWQVEKNYLPCRVFKNVSYGKAALTNVPKFRELFAGCSVGGSTIAETLDYALGLSEADHAELVEAQQAIVARYTYREGLLAIARALEEGK